MTTPPAPGPAFPGAKDEAAAAPPLIRVLVADDQHVVRKGLVLLLGMLDGIEVVGAARDGAEALTLARQTRPDVVLMDLTMPVLDGIAATTVLTEQQPGTAVLVLTTYVDDGAVFPALRAGARGYLTKDADDEEIETAIHRVHQGHTWLDPHVQARLVETLTRTPPPDDADRSDGTERADGLTPRETEVLSLIAQGMTNAQIRAHLVVSQATVKTHINRIFTKIGVTDRAQAVRYAFQHGLG